MSQRRMFKPYTVGLYAEVGKLKANNKVICHLSMKLSDVFDQNPLILLTK